jgi:hypothetical protein
MWRRALPLLLVLALLALVPLAHASPPDATWIGGWYDNADFDDVVITVTGTVALVEIAPHVDLRPVSLVVSHISAFDDFFTPLLRPAPRQPRAPPLA